MPRHLPTAALLLVSVAAQAQEIAPPAPADTLSRLPQVTITGLLTTDQLPALAPTIQDQLRRVPGVQVTPYSGAPGADAVLRLRSAVSLQHPTQPLFEVDGLPTLALTFGLFSQSPNVPLTRDFNPLLLLPPVSLDSVRVHTGAAATARAGMLGAGGVLALQTASGGGGGRPVRLSYSVQATAQQLRRSYALLGAREYAGLVNEARTSSPSGYPPAYSDDELARLGRGTDWQDELYGLGLGTDHQLRLRGEQANTRYAAQLGYLHQDGIMRNSWLSRYHAGLSVDQRLGRLELHAGALGTQLQERRPTPLAVAGALLSAPTIPVRDAAGAYSEVSSRQPEYLLHPLRMADDVYTSPRTRLLLTRLGATYHLGSDWQLSLRGGYDRVTQYTPIHDLVLTDLTYQRATYTPQRVGEQTHEVGTLAGRAEARYQHTFGEQHRVEASLGYDYQRPRYEGRYQVAYPSVGGGSSARVSMDNHPDALHNALASARYVLRGAYEWQASLWTTRLHKVAFVYPGGQFTWRAEQLPALRAKPWLSELRLWAAAGQSTAGLYDQFYLRNGPSYIIINPGTPLPPTPPAEFFYQGREQARTTHAELGATLGLWQQRLRVGLTAFRRQTNHATVPVWDMYQGHTYLVSRNWLALRNRGLELSVESRWQAGRLRGLTRLAAATAGNEVTRTPGPASAVPLPSGQPLGTVVGLQQDGLYPDGLRAGSLRFQTTDASSPYPDANRPLGGGAPRHSLSLFQRLTRARLSLDVQADALGGYQVFNDLLAAVEVPSGLYNSTTAVRDRWTPANQQTSTPRAGTTLAPPYVVQGSSTTSRSLSSGAHLHLTEVLLSYRLPTALPLTVYGGGRNLVVLTRYRGYDPNVSSAGADPSRPMYDQLAYPVPRTWLLGLNAEF